MAKQSGPEFLNDQDMLAELRKMDFKALCSDTHQLSMKDILDKMTESSNNERMRRSAPPQLDEYSFGTSPSRHLLTSAPSRHTRTKTWSPPRVGQRPATGPWIPTHRTVAPVFADVIKDDFTIARYRVAPPKWDGSLFSDVNLTKSLYREPNADPTGRMIRTLTRDESRGGKKWEPVEIDRSLQRPPTALYTDSAKAMVLAHLDKQIKKVDAIFSSLPQETESQRFHKAKIGADLFELQQEKQRLLESDGKSFKKIF